MAKKKVIKEWPYDPYQVPFPDWLIKFYNISQPFDKTLLEIVKAANPWKIEWKEEKPKPPEGYLLFKYGKIKKCPNCGNKDFFIATYCKDENGVYQQMQNCTRFQNRMAQNIYRAMERVERFYDKHEGLVPQFGVVDFVTQLNWNYKRGYNLFSTSLSDRPEDIYIKMLKCHPSRYGIAKLDCCGADVWYDLFGKWSYYYKPKKVEEMKIIEISSEDVRTKSNKEIIEDVKKQMVGEITCQTKSSMMKR